MKIAGYGDDYCRLCHFALFLVGWLCVTPAENVGQTIDIALDLYYNDPNDTASAGSWELVATASNRGIAGVVARLQDVALQPDCAAPTGSGAEVTIAGFHETFDDGNKSFATDRGDHLELLFGQVPVSAPGPQGLFYDVGTPGGATQPGENGTPVIAGLVGEGVPWNLDDIFGDFQADGDADDDDGEFEGGVLLAAGTFNSATNPRLYAGKASAGTVFTALGSATDPPAVGTIVLANVGTQTRGNLGTLVGDSNLDGAVNQTDLEIWNQNRFTQRLGWRNGDLNGDRMVDASDFNIWNSNRVVPWQTVPEPSSLLLVVMALCWRGLSIHIRCQRGS